MPKKKGSGLSRKKLAGLVRQYKLARSKGSRSLPDLLTYMTPVQLERRKVEVRLVTVGKEAVKTSTQRVLGDLGVKVLAVSEKPECVHALGSMIAARAIEVARGFVPSGREVISSIGRSSIDISVSPTGEITGPVTIGSVKKSSVPTMPGMGEIFPSAPNDGGSGGIRVPVNISSEQRSSHKNDMEVGKTTVVKDEHGVTHIHIHSLKVYITAELVQQLNVNPQLVQNVLASKLSDIGEIAQQKAQPQTTAEDNTVVEEEQKEEEQTEEEEKNDNKKKKRKPRNDKK